ncbi:hypothetical protein BT96DRAFT_948573 [Gymnopus androsaceus JB14]|uniref:Uncharacterized protein n=1 Tax=Gymnopus androsaceus JB14 TaxID=1447944 RepID=A0A6A4GN32_9AGAR|nr:hypothetical protein BT96DRAFT_948573 [Gymnopus androsaceus JB14]
MKRKQWSKTQSKTNRKKQRLGAPPKNTDDIPACSNPADRYIPNGFTFQVSWKTMHRNGHLKLGNIVHSKTNTAVLDKLITSPLFQIQRLSGFATANMTAAEAQAEDLCKQLKLRNYVMYAAIHNVACPTILMNSNENPIQILPNFSTFFCHPYS